MKGLAFRKLGRTSGHRHSLLRNLVTSLIHHERISTTLAKAKEAQRECEKVITLGKKIRQAELNGGRSQAKFTVLGKVYSPDSTLPLLQSLSQRYASRPGGYTRLHLHGNRQGDHAPRALLELVDGPRDMKNELTSRAMARETRLWEKEMMSKGGDLDSPIPAGEVKVAGEVNGNGNREAEAEGKEIGEGEGIYEKSLKALHQDKRFGSLTRKSIEKIGNFGGIEALNKLALMASNHLNRSRAIEKLEGSKIQSTSSYSKTEGLNKPLLVELMKSGNGPRGGSSIGSLDDKLETLDFGSVTLPKVERKVKAGEIGDEDYFGSGGNLEYQGRRRISGIGGGREKGGRKSVVRVARGLFVKREWRGKGAGDKGRLLGERRDQTGRELRN